MSDSRPARRIDDRSTAVERELQEFSYIVSHDLAASFRHVAEFSRLLMGEMGPSPTSQQQAHAAHISSATAKCQSMMEELLAYSRVQQKTLERVRLDATPVARLALMQLDARVQEAHAEVSIGPLGEVYADPKLLALAFHHLLDNAIKFRRPDVQPKITVEAARNGATWRMSITDNGLGVEPAYRDKAFGMFQRLNGEDAYPGVGAGLAICRRIARRHGGDIRFIDSVDGASIELALPDGEAFP
jgi:light-regulated signal transduction histidine kinase (bacteriophytochrome)